MRSSFKNQREATFPEGGGRRSGGSQSKARNEPAIAASDTSTLQGLGAIATRLRGTRNVKDDMMGIFDQIVQLWRRLGEIDIARREKWPWIARTRRFSMLEWPPRADDQRARLPDRQNRHNPTVTWPTLSTSSRPLPSDTPIPQSLPVGPPFRHDPRNSTPSDPPERSILQKSRRVRLFRDKIREIGDDI